MTYPELLEFLFHQLPMFHRVGKAAYKADLSRSIALDAHFGHPHRQYRTIHVAGTNGKGSVSHMLAAVLAGAGCRTGLFTSPHLKDFRERIRLNGQMIPEDYLLQFFNAEPELFSNLGASFFEMTTALAFQYFADAGAEVAVIETGLGGRLDSTNVIEPCMTVITNISYDHADLLGQRLEQIAGEKAGIIKAGIPIVIGETQPGTSGVFIEKAGACGAPLCWADQTWQVEAGPMGETAFREFSAVHRGTSRTLAIRLDLAGDYQAHNLATVLTVLDQLESQGFSLPSDRVTQSLAHAAESTGLAGRWQVVSRTPLVVCDTAHNEGGLRMVVSQIRSQTYRRLYCVIGMVNDKEIGVLLDILPREAYYFFTQASVPRALPAKVLAEAAMHAGLSGEVVATVPEARDRAQAAAGPGDMVFIGGSTFVVAEAL